MLLGDLNLVRGTEDVLVSSTTHAGGFNLFASLCVAGHMHDAMPQELEGTGVFTNRYGAGRLLPAESLPFGLCARLDYVLVPQDSVVTQWHVPSDRDTSALHVAHLLAPPSIRLQSYWCGSQMAEGLRRDRRGGCSDEVGAALCRPGCE